MKDLNTALITTVSKLSLADLKTLLADTPMDATSFRINVDTGLYYKEEGNMRTGTYSLYRWVKYSGTWIKDPKLSTLEEGASYRKHACIFPMGVASEILIKGIITHREKELEESFAIDCRNV